MGRPRRPAIDVALPLLLLAVLIAANGMFVAAEFALITVERSRVEELAHEGDRGATRVLRALRTLSFQLSGAQLGITITSLVAGYVAEPALAHIVEPVARWIPGIGDAVADNLTGPLALVTAAAVQMVLGELVPKNASIARPLEVARIAGPFQAAFSAVFRPVITFLNGSANFFVRRLGIEPQEELGSARSAEELAQLVRHSARAGVLPPGTARVLHRALRFSEKQADEAMTPRTDVVSLPPSATVADLMAAARDSGHSRFPVRGANLDEITGIAVVHDAFPIAPERRAKTPVRAIVRPPVLVPTSLNLDRVVERLREAHTQLAVVVDEYGGTAGVVTAEDLAEELVGDLADEHDPMDEPDAPFAPPARDTTQPLRLSGLLRADEVEEASGWRMPEGDYSTLAGLVLAHLGHVPQVGEWVDVEDRRVIVAAMDKLRVDEVEIVRLPGEPGERDEPGGPGEPGTEAGPDERRPDGGRGPAGGS
ncbi:CNNM domain-containing protein [Yinghuangia soli]|uniref:CNNM domain-containing protein n=1 Tax=Yinghuangia soli TaxID=2908204 RepID=A0AA41U2Y5_9ACTN|nr:CNNM domain-containing protein [Yinghuangia soli]MCF2527564.1 CNNM domain-containing protein [Yinghuangia soli]